MIPVSVPAATSSQNDVIAAQTQSSDQQSSSGTTTSSQVTSRSPPVAQQEPQSQPPIVENIASDVIIDVNASEESSKFSSFHITSGTPVKIENRIGAPSNVRLVFWGYSGWSNVDYTCNICCDYSYIDEQKTGTKSKKVKNQCVPSCIRPAIKSCFSIKSPKASSPSATDWGLGTNCNLFLQLIRHLWILELQSQPQWVVRTARPCLLSIMFCKFLRSCNMV